MDSEKRLIDRKGCSRDMDRISQLPPPTVHHILSFLSQKEAVQTCLLSKTWRYLGSTRPNLEFREVWFMPNTENFLSVVGNTLQRYHDQNLSIQQLNLEMRTTDNNPKLVSFLGEWIPIVMLNMGLKTFKLYLSSYSPKNFDMPSVVFQAKSLQELDLLSCKLNFDNNSIDNLLALSNLRKLDLHFVHISEKTLEHMLSSCPLIEFLNLNCCELLRTINLRKAGNLKHFGFGAYSGNESSTVIHVPTSTLESIRTVGSPNWFFHPENVYFPRLKSLHQIIVKLSAQSFDKFSYNYCPCLENLTLESCKDFEGFQLSSRSITHLEKSTREKIRRLKGSPNWFSHPENTYFPHLKSLHLIYVKLSAQSFDKFSSNYCPCLENLKLHDCKDFEVFQLSSRSITHLEISTHAKIEGLRGAIDAPNILYFKYSGCVVPSFSFTTTSSEWESHICFKGHEENDAFQFHQDLKELLKALSHSRIYLELHPLDDDGGGGSSCKKPVQVEVVNCKSRRVFFSSSSFPVLMNCLLRTCRPRCIEMTNVTKELFCALWGRGRAKPVESNPCTIILGELEITSWKKDLEKCSIEVWNKNAGDWCGVEGHIFKDVCPEDVWEESKHIRFRLKWRE